jgi:transglutaminase-like putative cysteine protease
MCHRHRCFLALFVISISTLAHGGIPFQPVSPDELRMTNEPMAPGAPAVILFREVDRDDNSRSTHEDNYIRIKILTEQGRKYADVEIPFLKQNADVVQIHARTIRPDGSIAEFNGKVFEKDLVKGRIGGRQYKYQAKTFTLPDVQVGCIIEYSYTIDFQDYMIFESHWTLNDDLFTKKASFSLNPYSREYSLRWCWNSLPEHATPPKQEANRMIRMTVENVPAFREEEYMPPEEEMKSRIDFIYEEPFFVAKDQGEYWKRVGKQRNGQLEGFINKHKAMEEAVAQIIAPSDTPEAKLRKIYARVQQFRNTSYEVEKTEQQQKREKEKPPENVEEVWKRGYANGGQLTWLFLALARAAGFEAYGCWVADRKNYFFSPVTMQGYKLNSNVVLVKLNGKDLYLDPGAAFTPFGLLTWSETQVRGLKLDSNGGTWIQTTLPQSSESQIRRTGNLALSETGDLAGKVTITYTGLEAMYRRLEERNADEVERKKYLEDQLNSEIGVAAQVDLLSHPDWSGSETPLTADFNVKIEGWITGAGSHAVIPAAIFTAGERGTFEHEVRVQPIYFEYPYSKSDDITVELPAGWNANSLPIAQDQDGHVIHYSLKVDNNTGKLRLTRNFSLDFTLVETKYYPALRRFFQTVRTGDEEQIVLQPGAIHVSN